MDNNNNKEEINLNADQIISLMSVYLDEWKHRDKILWSQVFKIFYAVLLVTILPNIASFLEISLPEINKIFFPIAGTVMNVIFLYVGLGYAKRLEASADTYKNVMKLLGDPKYQRVSVKDIKGGEFFSIPLAKLIVITMFLALQLLAISIMLV